MKIQERLSQKLQQIFEQTQRFNGLQDLVQQTLSQFKTQAKDQTALEV